MERDICNDETRQLVWHPCRGLAITVGAYSLFRTSSVASWLERGGVQHSLPTAAFLRQVKIPGILFIAAGGFFVVVAIGSH